MECVCVGAVQCSSLVQCVCIELYYVQVQQLYGMLYLRTKAVASMLQLCCSSVSIKEQQLYGMRYLRTEVEHLWHALPTGAVGCSSRVYLRHVYGSLNLQEQQYFMACVTYRTSRVYLSITSAYSNRAALSAGRLHGVYIHTVVCICMYTHTACLYNTVCIHTACRGPIAYVQLQVQRQLNHMLSLS